MAEILRVLKTDVFTNSQVKFFLSRATKKVATTPVAAASDGVAMPKKMTPMTLKMMMKMGRADLSVTLSFSRSDLCGIS